VMYPDVTLVLLVFHAGPRSSMRVVGQGWGS
jgi:hypothetical protein